MTYLLSFAGYCACFMVLAFIFRSLRDRLARLSPRAAGLLFGGVMALIAIVGMSLPVIGISGLYFDGRFVFIALACLFGGAHAGLLTAIAVGAFRLLLGAKFVLPILLPVALAWCIGMAFRQYDARTRREDPVANKWLMGLLLALANLATVVLYPRAMISGILHAVAVPMLISFPLASVLFASLIYRELHNYRTEQRLRQSEEKYRRLVEDSPDIIASCTPQGLLTQANAQLLAIVPESVGIVGRLNLGDIFTGTDRVRWLDALKAMPGVQRTSFEASGLTVDGKKRCFTFTLSGVFDSENALAEIIVTGHDITDQMHAKQELEDFARTLESKVEVRTHELNVARVEAESAARAKAEFLANMSHEIRTPLNAVIGMSQLAVRINLDTKVGHYLERIRTSGQHLLSTVNDILDFSKIEAGKLSIEFNGFSLELLLEHVTGLVWERADAKNLELIVMIEPGIPDQLIGDAQHLGQVLINFINNAVKFTEIGEVLVKVRQISRNGDAIRVAFDVEDTGIGIAADDMPSLFQPFQQLDSSMGRRFEGTGLGLIISKKLSDLMAGHITVRSELGKGSVFSLEVPLKVPAGSQPSIMQSIDLRNRSALVVDDNEHARELLATLLRSFSMNADQSASGQDAIDMLARADEREKPYDLVFIDWKMPGLSGQQTAEQIRLLTLRCGTPRLVLIAPTIDHAMGPGHAAQGTQFDATLAKPVSPSELFNTVAGLFNPLSNPVQTGSQPAEASYATLHGRTVLVVEDNEINQEVARDLLQIVGMHVTLASDGLQALQILQRQRFDVVLMDVQMPVMSGLEATAAIRKDSRLADLTIIALTANALNGDRERCISAGMDDYIAKPIDPGQMFQTLARALSGETRSARPSAPLNEAPDADMLLLQALREIPELDVDLGLARMLGRVDLYAKLLTRFTSDQAHLPHLLRTAIESDDLDEAARLMHGLKSLVGTLGATALQQRCLELEQQVQEKAITVGTLENFESAYARLVKGLRASLQGGVAQAQS